MLTFKLEKYYAVFLVEVYKNRKFVVGVGFYSITEAFDYIQKRSLKTTA